MDVTSKPVSIFVVGACLKKSFRDVALFTTPLRSNMVTYPLDCNEGNIGKALESQQLTWYFLFNQLDQLFLSLLLKHK